MDNSFYHPLAKEARNNNIIWVVATNLGIWEVVAFLIKVLELVGQVAV